MIVPFAIGCLGFAFLLALGLNWLALRPWRRSAGRHWAERARLLHPARRSAQLNNWLIPANLVVVSFVLWPDMACLSAGLSGFAGAALAGYFMSREVFPGLRFKPWLHLVAALLMIFIIGWVVLIAAILAMPASFGFWTWLLAAVVLAILVSLNFGLSLQLLRRMRLLRPAGEHLQSLVNAVSGKMGVPVKATWVLSAHLCNAAAFPLIRQLVFTDKLLATSPDGEIKAICAHELGHLNEPRRVLLMRLLVSMAFYPLIFINPLSSPGGPGSSAAPALIIAVLILWLMGIRLSRRMEKRADKIAVENQEEAAVDARALERLYQANQTPAVMPKRSGKIHPNLYDRMVAAGVTLDFEKPAPAKGLCWTSYLLFSSLFLFSIPVGLAEFAFHPGQ